MIRSQGFSALQGGCVAGDTSRQRSTSTCACVFPIAVAQDEGAAAVTDGCHAKRTSAAPSAAARTPGAQPKMSLRIDHRPGVRPVVNETAARHFPWRPGLTPRPSGQGRGTGTKNSAPLVGAAGGGVEARRFLRCDPSPDPWSALRPKPMRGGGVIFSGAAVSRRPWGLTGCFLLARQGNDSFTSGIEATG